MATHSINDCGGGVESWVQELTAVRAALPRSTAAQLVSRTSWYRIAAVIVTVVAATFMTMNSINPAGLYRSTYHISIYQPPPWVFSAVWTVLYAMYAFAWVYSSRALYPVDVGFRFIDVLFGVGLLINAAWPFSLFLVNMGWVTPELGHFMSNVAIVAMIVHAYVLSYYVYTMLRGAAYALVAVFMLCVYASWGYMALALGITAHRRR